MPDARTKTTEQTISLGLALVVTLVLGWAGINWPNFGTANFALLLLVPVVIAASGGGRMAGLGLAVLAGAVFNFVALEPRLTFAIAKSGDLLTLGVYALVAFVTASVAARLAEAGERARQDAADSAIFSAMTQQLLAASTREQVLEVAAKALEASTQRGVSLVETIGDLRLSSSQDEAAARWALAHSEMAGRGLPLFSDASSVYVAAHAGRRALLARLEGSAPQLSRLAHARDMIDEAADALDRLELAARIEADTRRTESEAMRRAIFASIGHDLRTPMTTLRAGLESISYHDPEVINPIRADALRLERTLDNLLELARLQASDALPEVSSMDLTDTIDAAIGALPQAIRDRIEVTIAEDTPLIQSDPIMLHHIVLNLLENAGKYSPETTSIQVLAHPLDGGARLSVMDEGPGIGEDVADLFGLFKRGHHSDRAPGSGVGLSVVDSFARALGHRVSIANRTDKTGTIFAIDFSDRTKLA
ncbi:ATP-binding protein [Aquidulcibacter sp.]|uniref:ATP-binding protein n=1 Tax=Aquidulcibacter sp. TaxID=2052990 RepID=UPI0025C3B7B9|nr:ATP-binding protein [Aquidulcibacter sp.]MCA3694157.1 DUF4118 domain-containing protein [Aquidulcibacter sp.]